MSTMSTQVNWGAGVLVNDVYRRFVRPDASERDLVWCGRFVTAGLMTLACSLALWLENALQVFAIILQIGAGTGLLFLLRWFWWRINAATELAAMIVSLTVAILFESTALAAWEPWEKLVVGVAVTTATWLVVAFTSAPTDEATLRAFCRRIRPDGPGWNRVRAGIGPDTVGDGTLSRGICATAIGTTLVYASIATAGFWLYGRAVPALGCLSIAAVAGALLYRLLARDPGGALLGGFRRGNGGGNDESPRPM
jgi:hypothetical protein